MRFDIFQKSSDAHVRKAREYLQQANLARIEHQAAAEHHAALAAMYLQRAHWLEQELAGATTGNVFPVTSVAPRQIDSAKRAPEAVLSWPRAHAMKAVKIPESA
jgi:hypothetical protein